MQINISHWEKNTCMDGRGYTRQPGMFVAVTQQLFQYVHFVTATTFLYQCCLHTNKTVINKTYFIMIFISTCGGSYY